MIKKGLIVLFTWDVMRKSMFKRLVYTPPDSSPRFTSKLNLSNTKNPAWFFILASLLDRGIQRVNWLPPRTIVARVFLKIIFRGCPCNYPSQTEQCRRDWWMPHYDATANANTIHFPGLIYCDRTWLLFLGVQIRLLTQCKVCFTPGLSNYFSLKSLSLPQKSDECALICGLQVYCLI